MTRLLSMVDAILACAPEHLEDKYREFRFMYWDDGVHEFARRYQEYGEDVPWTIQLAGRNFQQGQWSGPSGRVIWFEEIQE